jgi:hypothetical protein
MLHTGANTQLGGLKKGFSRPTYQSFTELWVAKLDKKPTKRQIVTEMKM